MGEKVDSDIEASLKLLSHINKLRKNQLFSDYTKCGFLFVTQTGKTLELSNKIKEEVKQNLSVEEVTVCSLAVSMSFLTNILWYKMNRGFGVHNYPKNLDSVIKAKIVLSNFISQNVSDKYKEFQKQYKEGTLSADQMAGRLLKLREKATKPEDLTLDNVEDNLNFDLAYLEKYEEEKESQRIQLKEKIEIIDKIDNDLRETKNTSEERRKIIISKDTLISRQQKMLEERDEKLAKYEKIVRIIKFIWALIWRGVIVCLITYAVYRFVKYLGNDLANTVGIVVTLLTAILGIVGSVKNVIKLQKRLKK